MATKEEVVEQISREAHDSAGEINAIKYGKVTFTIQDGEVVLMETNKTKKPNPPRRGELKRG
ncbi:DUF2292 domain-containing protein [Anaeroselena agilis]|uniref:DUF2292 domain-containing protein n=1 Tax=Anaeroselena agilis TaxID=3063788 RepID=A0ABU3NYH2_9FIRM|nr:DUF2292 domain-containing protein [Selenomonadales bacterium 4137-cl]